MNKAAGTEYLPRQVGLHEMEAELDTLCINDINKYNELLKLQKLMDLIGKILILLAILFALLVFISQIWILILQRG